MADLSHAVEVLRAFRELCRQEEILVSRRGPYWMFRSPVDGALLAKSRVFRDAVALAMEALGPE